MYSSSKKMINVQQKLSKFLPFLSDHAWTQQCRIAQVVGHHYGRIQRGEVKRSDRYIVEPDGRIYSFITWHTIWKYISERICLMMFTLQEFISWWSETYSRLAWSRGKTSARRTKWRQFESHWNLFDSPLSKGESSVLTPTMMISILKVKTRVIHPVQITVCTARLAWYFGESWFE